MTPNEISHYKSLIKQDTGNRKLIKKLQLDKKALKEQLILSGVVGQSEQLDCECIAWCVGENVLKESHKCADKFVTKG